MRSIEQPVGAPWTLPAVAGVTLIIASVVGVDRLVTTCAIALELTFLAYFVRHMAFALSAMRSAPADLSAPLMDTGFRPTVTVIVACKNEESVIDALVDSLVGLE
jgi:arginine exporter protein ArgO